MEAGELGSHRWLGVAGTCRGGKRESGVAGLEGGGWGLAPNTQTEHDGSEWGWRWANGAHAGGLGLQGPAAVVNERVGGRLGIPEGGGWGLAPNTQTERDGLEWGWKWVNGAHTGGLGFQGPTAVVHERVGGGQLGVSRGQELGFGTEHPN